MSCHDEESQKGKVSLEDLTDVTHLNASIWKRIWEEISLKEMPPKKKKTQPSLEERYQLSQWITSSLESSLLQHGGFSEHLRPNKGNHLDHNLLFGNHNLNLNPTSSPARLWRVHPQEHMVRLKALFSTGPKYNPEKPGLRTQGDHIQANFEGETKVYYGLDRYLFHVGGTAAYAAAVTGFPPILSTTQDHGIKNYPILYSVNGVEATQIASAAENILRYMIHGPDAKPYQFTENKKNVSKKYRSEQLRGLPSSIFYTKKIKRPLTPVYDLYHDKKTSDQSIKNAVNFLIESLTLRPAKTIETENYLKIVKDTIKRLGKNDGIILGLSPIFLDRDALFRSELTLGSKPDKHGRRLLQDWELALAINGAFSYLGPDSTLKQAVTTGKLKTRHDVKREVMRLLKDESVRKPRLLQFFREYFEYDLAPKVCKDNKALLKSGGHSRSYYKAMNNMVFETDRLIEYILQKDKHVLKELLTTDKIIVNTKLDGQYLSNFDKEYPSANKKNKAIVKHRPDVAHFYKVIFDKEKTPISVRLSQFITNKEDDGSRVLTKVNTKQRLGILTHPSWLVSHSDAMDNHAILRGKWIRERLLGGAVADVPITVDAMLPDEPHSTLRHRMRVTQEKDCKRCHQKMDPLGLPFEMYNHIGLYREKELGKHVDTSGKIIDSGDPSLDGPVKDAIDMIWKIANSKRTEEVFARHAFRFWMGRNETIDDGPILKEAVKAYRVNNGSMKALLAVLLTSDAFLYRLR